MFNLNRFFIQNDSLLLEYYIFFKLNEYVIQESKILFLKILIIETIQIEWINHVDLTKWICIINKTDFSSLNAGQLLLWTKNMLN